MSLISELQNERSRYYVLRDKIKLICNHLNNSRDDIKEAAKQLEQFYLINEEVADYEKLNTIASNTSTIKDILINKIIPAINNKINQLNNEIDKASELITE